MLSPKMQRPVRINETQLQMLAERARYDPTLAGPLYKRTADGTKWQLRWFTLYQNVLFYSESENWSRPTGIVFLEGSYCDRLIVTGNKKPAPDKQYCFAITYRREHQRAYELRAENESDCQTWIQAIRQASFNKLMLQKEELEQKHLHLLQIVESEKTAKWQYTQQCEELTTEIKKLRAELCMLKKEWRLTPSVVKQTGEGPNTEDVESEDLKKIRKVQSFFRGWLCRHRWKQIVEEYIRSPHAESMRKRNSLVFRMVETEEEYVAQLEILVACFLRPMKMLASSKKPPCSHDDLNSIFLNAETVFFLHQIFLKGLLARMNSWPTLVLGDLFDMLLPMLHIYQEYVRNHHFSLQVLTECKQSTSFAAMLNRLENKAPCQGRSLETFLTYPMHQIPRYIITLHELLAHTPHDHVERKSLENARDQLEDLSRQMHDEVSETENIRKNLAIERMIIEGCDILMDVNQVFVRQGSLLHVVPEKSRSQRGRLSVSTKSSEKEQVRQCFLFSSHLIIATRTQGGRLTLVPNVGKISLADVTLVEDPGEHNNSTNDDDGDSSVCSMSSQSSGISESSVSGSTSTRTDYHGLDFQLLVDSKKDCGGGSGSMVVHLVAPSVADKAAWISDLSQCIDNVHFNDFVHLAPDTSSVTHPQSIRNDPKLFTDDVDIRFSRTLNSCKVPQIRYATPSRLLDRLTDLRFLSIDFLNTFLLTYRVFTDSVTVLDALKKVFYAGETEAATTPSARNSVVSIELCSSNRSECGTYLTASNLEAEPRDIRDRGRSLSPRRTSSGSTVSGYGSETHERERSHSREYANPLGLTPSSRGQWWRRSRRKDEEERLDVSPARSLFVSFTPSSPSPSTSVGPNSPFTSPRGSAQWGASSGGLRPGDSLGALSRSRRNSRQNQAQSQSLSSTETAEAPEEAEEAAAAAEAAAATVQAQDDGNHLTIPNMGSSLSADTLTDAISVDSAHTNFSTSTNTLVAFNMDESATKESTSSIPEHAETSAQESESQEKTSDSDKDTSSNTGHDNDEKIEEEPAIPPPQQHALRRQSLITGQSDSVTSASDLDFDDGETSHSYSYSVRSSWASQGPSPLQSLYGARRFRRRDGDGPPPAPSTTSRHAPDSPQLPRSVGVVVTSNRQSQRRSSTSHAAAAFAVATAGSSNPRDHPIIQRLGSGKAKGSLTGSAGPSLSEHRGSFQNYRKESVMSTAATMRVLNVLRHWISKHQQDFDNDARLKNLTVEFLEDVLSSPQLLPAEHKAASQLLRLLTREEPAHARIDLDVLLALPMSTSKDGIETLSALEIAEQMTYLDHKIFVSIRSEELLNQAWMKPDKATRAPNVLLITKRFNEVSLLVSSEIMRRTNLTARIAVIDKWTAVADICRCLHNFNGVLQICSSLNSNAVFRLKKTWEKLSKTTRQTIEKLQNIVSSDGRFRNLRDALHRCDPPCIPYLGMYLTDLSFIEEGTPNFTEDGLLNFSKMRMIAHVIREIRHFQQMPYKIEHVPKVTNYLLDPSLLLSEDELYQLSLEMEPRQSRLGSISQQAPPPPTSLAT